MSVVITGSNQKSLNLVALVLSPYLLHLEP